MSAAADSRYGDYITIDNSKEGSSACVTSCMHAYTCIQVAVCMQLPWFLCGLCVHGTTLSLQQQQRLLVWSAQTLNPQAATTHSSRFQSVAA